MPLSPCFAYLDARPPSAGLHSSESPSRCDLVRCAVCFQVMTEQRVTARDEQYNSTNSPYIQVRPAAVAVWCYKAPA
jgi:hypothetical protein